MGLGKLLLVIKEASKKIPWDKVEKYGTIVIAKGYEMYDKRKRNKQPKDESTVSPENINPIDTINIKFDNLFSRINTIEGVQTSNIELLNSISSQVAELTNYFKVLSSRITLAIIVSLIALIVGVISIALKLLST